MVGRMLVCGRCRQRPAASRAAVAPRGRAGRLRERCNGATESSELQGFSGRKRPKQQEL
ncbi:hypothetical protein CBM2585_A10146 [Cupriavidus taiwanensis]|nr:hypothetical protein CBM2585_A10146 [Cupriavidus taiwanensis]SOY99824.1 hypothetical protein CBM2595_A10152 [Cupriavidus taiwanensis]